MSICFVMAFSALSAAEVVVVELHGKTLTAAAVQISVADSRPGQSPGVDHFWMETLTSVTSLVLRWSRLRCWS